ncbi:GDSL-type esterase/lipase family protein [Cellulomonas sp. PhB143]|uniref:GDSL-type esterase/lipase family protein n=1 Tax=Cellulomonas sp. PhB143 TaxID=2485186 RepID=UPI000F47F10F|nr:GDSL-type esterase/lipase family protein [Cellulomonas sp. PhB143]ROS78940.1 GDSL-like lipase/acylhydrolase family protein [Cellulomonas sp. PhB143]
MTGPTTSRPLAPVDLDPAWVRGAVEVERTPEALAPHRIPAWAVPRIPDLFMAETVRESAGVRLAVRTAADVVEIDYDGMRMAEDERVALAPGVWDVTEEGALVAQASAPPGTRYLFSFERPTTARVAPGPPSTVRFAGLGQGSERELEIWLPFTDGVRILAVRADAPVRAAGPSSGLRWVHHGSSISHGYAAASTTGTWPVLAALRAGVDLTSVAYSGNAMLDQFVARIIGDLDADLISVKVGINLVNGDVMRVRGFRPALHGFVDTIRDRHPDTPIVLASPIFCEPVEHAAGPTIDDPTKDYGWCVAGGTAQDVAAGKLSLAVVREEIAAIVDQRGTDDPNLTYVDGLGLYGPDDARAHTLPDNLHPGPDVQRMIGERWADTVLARFASRFTERTTVGSA